MEDGPLLRVITPPSPGLPLPFLHSLLNPEVSSQRIGVRNPLPLLKGQVQTSIPCYVSELSSVPNQRQPDLLLLIDLIFSYQRAGRGWGDSIDQKPTRQWRRLINYKESRSWVGSEWLWFSPSSVLWVSKRTFSSLPHFSNPSLTWGESWGSHKTLSQISPSPQLWTEIPCIPIWAQGISKHNLLRNEGWTDDLIWG